MKTAVQFPVVTCSSQPVLEPNTRSHHGLPRIIHRCPDRVLFARQKWELPTDKGLTCPCIFTCSGIVLKNELIMAYGAADKQVGIARTDLDKLVAYVITFDTYGEKII